MRSYLPPSKTRSLPMTGAIFHPGKVIAAHNSCLRYEPYDLMEKTIRKRAACRICVGRPRGYRGLFVVELGAQGGAGAGEAGFDRSGGDAEHAGDFVYGVALRVVQRQAQSERFGQG